MNFCVHFNNLERVGKTQYQKHHAHDAEEVERYGFFKKLKARVTRVKRSGEWLNMKSRNVVPGDFVKLTLGGLIPADCVGREIDLCGHVPDDWRISAGYHEKGRQAHQFVDPFKEFKTARPNVSYRSKVNEFASLWDKVRVPVQRAISPTMCEVA